MKAIQKFLTMCVQPPFKNDVCSMFHVQFTKSVFVTYVTMDMSRINLQSYKSIKA
jgi:hypothetical protein